MCNAIIVTRPSHVVFYGRLNKNPITTLSPQMSTDLDFFWEKMLRYFPISGCESDSGAWAELPVVLQKYNCCKKKVLPGIVYIFMVPFHDDIITDTVKILTAFIIIYY